ncbi:hypothetical protein [Mycobacterium sp. OTB74]|uniref:hypothetical protein n=1 Tax=Mycobacterium sp. OTB74 TaxID=1853452 RepID=UPI002473796F|nr:hypothetical protein [Mycobacterium sp. OTB74]MDH6244084.1 hypothetical protein [Mycobacterium sp. OTB74]
MTTHARPLRIPRLRPSVAKAEDQPDNSISSEKSKLIGGVATAFIGGLATIVTGIGVAIVQTHAQQAHSTPIAEVRTSDRGSVESVTVDDSGTKVTVSGIADPDIEAVGVVLTAANTTGLNWIGTTGVSNGKWTLELATEPEAPSPFTLSASYKKRASTASGVFGASYTVKLDGPTPTPPRPAPPQQCTSKTPDSCFTGPGWGSPSIYESQ